MTEGTTGPPVFVCGDYTQAGDDAPGDLAGWRSFDATTRRRRERRCSQEVGLALGTALPTDEVGRASLLEAGYAAASAMSWDRVVDTQYLQALARMERRSK